HVRSWKTIQPKALAVEQKMTLWREEQVKATDAYAAHFLFEEKLLEASTKALPKKYTPPREPDKVKNPLEDFVSLTETDAKVRHTSASTARLQRDAAKLDELAADAEQARSASTAAAKEAEKNPSNDTLQQAADAALRESRK